MKILDYLQKTITDTMSLAEMVDAFEKMCQIEIDSETDMILFETGTYDFSGPEYFYFNLVRQFDGEDDEYTQLHLEIMYEPNSTNEEYTDFDWDEDVEGDFFDMVRQSEIYHILENVKFVKYDIYMDET